eukprot:1607190-Prymnesium_polylepis.1
MAAARGSDRDGQVMRAAAVWRVRAVGAAAARAALSAPLLLGRQGVGPALARRVRSARPRRALCRPCRCLQGPRGARGGGRAAAVHDDDAAAHRAPRRRARDCRRRRRRRRR